MAHAVMMILNHILRVLAATLLLIQISLPYAQAQAVANGADLASLICNPSGRSVSAEAESALGALLEVLGQEGDEAETPPDCDRCVSPHVALPSVSISILERPVFARAVHDRPAAEALAPNAPRGPPCGKRAPPLFV